MKIYINWNLTKQLITFDYSINWWQCWNMMINTLRTDDGDLRFYITTVQDG